jgi:C-terminal processing protease CtpA/Prc
VTLGAPAKDAAATPEGCKRCAYLGVLTVPTTSLSDETADRLGLQDDKGLVVIDVVPGSPAAAAGLRHGDVIRSIDGAEVSDPDALREHVKQAGTGKGVALTVRRGDRTREVKATLAEGPCDVLLFTPRGRVGGDKIDQLQQKIEALERRIKQLEGKNPPKPEK